MITPARPCVKFQPGQLVRHKRHSYRGVVVHADSTCQAPDAWYQSNKTQPDRNQPWYHVLVDGTSTVTYSAQSNLEPDDSAKKIAHPLVGLFFSAFLGKAYVRNEQPWPDTWE